MSRSNYSEDLDEQDTVVAGLARIAVSPEILGMIFSNCTVRCSGLPEGARFRYWFRLDERRELHLVFEHESFAPLRPGDEIPIIDVTCTEIR